MTPAAKQPAFRVSGVHAAAAAVFLASLAIYLRTLAPVFLFDDNSEFIASSHTLGVTHAPGYPLLSLIGKLFSGLLPLPISFGANLMSAVMGALAMGLLATVGTRLVGRPLMAAAAACVAAVATTFWTLSSQLDSYSFNLACSMALILLAWRVARRPAAPAFFLFVFAGGMALIVHYTAALVMAALGVYTLINLRGVKWKPDIWAAGGLFMGFLALSVFMYLPLRAAANPLIHWGTVDEFTGFLRHVRGVDIGKSVVPLYHKWLFVRDYIRETHEQITPWAFLFIIPGLFGLRRSRERMTPLLLFSILFGGFLVTLHYLYSERAVDAVSTFYIPTYVFLCMLILLGADTLAGRLPRVPEAVWAAALLALAIVTGARNFPKVDASGDMIAVDYGKNLFISLERDAIFFSPIETESFPLANLRAVYGMRQDVRMFGHHGDSAGDVYIVGKMGLPYDKVRTIGDVEKLILTREYFREPIFYSLRRPFPDNPEFRLFVDGMAYRLNPQPTVMIRRRVWDKIHLDGIDLKRRDYPYMTRNVIGKIYIHRAEFYLERGQQREALAILERLRDFNPTSRFLRIALAGIYIAVEQPDRAVREYEAALRCPRETAQISMDDVAINSNLSFLYGRMGLTGKAEKSIRKAARLAPEYPLVQINLGKTLWSKGDCPGAVKAMEKAVALGGRDSSAYNILGLCYEKLNDPVKAERNYLAAIKLDPEFPDPYRDSGVFYAYARGDFRRAIPMLEKYIELDPKAKDIDDIRATLGLMRYYTGDCAGAKPALLETVRSGRMGEAIQRAIIRNALGVCLAREGDGAGARAQFEAGIASGVAYAELYKNYGAFLADRGTEIPRAIQLLRQYLQLSPNAEDAAEVRSRLRVLGAR